MGGEEEEEKEKEAEEEEEGEGQISIADILDWRVFEHDKGVEVDGQRIAGVEIHVVPGRHESVHKRSVMAAGSTRNRQCSSIQGAADRNGSAQHAVHALCR